MVGRVNVSSSSCGLLYNNPETTFFQFDDLNYSLSNTLSSKKNMAYTEYLSVVWNIDTYVASKYLLQNTQLITKATKMTLPVILPQMI